MEHKLKQSSAPLIEIDKSHPLFQKKIVITGFRDKTVEENIVSKGGELGTSVSKNTFIVIAKDVTDDTGKVMLAKEKNIPLMTLEEFNEKYFA